MIVVQCSIVHNVDRRSQLSAPHEGGLLPVEVHCHRTAYVVQGYQQVKLERYLVAVPKWRESPVVEESWRAGAPPQELEPVLLPLTLELHLSTMRSSRWLCNSNCILQPAAPC